ncbi:hypothetical protein Trydic_g2335 [Trypoxylus dichotomus]
MQSTLETITTALASSRKLENCELVPLEESRSGEGVIAVVNRVVFRGTNAENEIRAENLVLKTAPTHAIYRTSSPIHEMYENEIYAYETALPTLEGTFKRFGMKFVNFPRCYLTNTKENEEYLVLEDLKSGGFKLWSKEKTMDDGHLFVVLENLAKFHAASFYLKEKQKDTWNELVGGLNNVSKKFFCDTEFCEAVIEMANTLDPLFKDQNDTLQRFQAFRDYQLKEFMCSICNDRDSEFVIAHGDVWCNNILFKYEDQSNPSKPTDIAILDYQAIRLSSVAIDLSFFLCVSCSKESMSSLDTYLQYYYEKLAQNLSKMDFDPDIVFPRSSLFCQWKRYNKFGLCMSLVTLHGINSDSDEFPSLEEVLKYPRGFWFALNFKSRNEKRYQERIKDVILHFTEKDYIGKLEPCLWGRKR